MRNNGYESIRFMFPMVEDDADIEAAKGAGAIEAGCDTLLEKVTGGWMEFDVAIASPKVMGKVGKLGRVLGPQGKMQKQKNSMIWGCPL